jgi:ABC-type phosphate/phosphonate transport system substrate-binding protein
VLSIAFRDDPGLRFDLRIIGTLGPSTIQSLTVARRMPATLKSDLCRLLVEMAEDPEAKDLLDQNFIERFFPIDDSDYDDVRRMCGRGGSAGFESLVQSAVPNRGEKMHDTQNG